MFRESRAGLWRWMGRGGRGGLMSLVEKVASEGVWGSCEGCLRKMGWED